MRTQALRDYSRKLWIRCEAPLAEAACAEFGRPSDDVAARAIARHVLEIPEFIGDQQNPLAALDAVFDLLEHGLAGAEAASAAAAEPHSADPRPAHEGDA